MKSRSTDQQKLSYYILLVLDLQTVSRFVAEISKTFEEPISQITHRNQSGFKQIPRMKGPKGEPF